MNKRELGLAALGVTVIVAGTGFVVAQLVPEDDRIQVVAEPTPTAGADLGPGGTPATGTPGTPAAGTPTPQAPGDGAEPDADTGPGTETGPRTSTEVLPSEPVDVILPPSKPPAALISLPLPPAASSLGEIVAGYPSAVMPALPGSVVDHSSVAAQGSRLQAALEARVTVDTADILAFYRQHFAPLGLLESPVEATKRRTMLSFARADGAVTLSVTAVAGGSSYLLFGVFTAPD